MLHLFIDASIHGAAVAITAKEKNDLLFCDQTKEITDSAKILPLMVEQGLRQLKFSMSDIQEISVSIGPGSFTGIRVGIAYGMGLAYGLGDKVQISGWSSLEDLTREEFYKNKNHPVGVLLPSTQTTGYVALAQGQDIQIEAFDLDKVDVFFGNKLGQSRHWIFVGEWELLSRRLAEFASLSIQSIPQSVIASLAVKAMAKYMHLSKKTFQKGDRLEPIYLRKSTVEEKEHLAQAKLVNKEFKQ